mgnify:FL=1
MLASFAEVTPAPSPDSSALFPSALSYFEQAVPACLDAKARAKMDEFSSADDMALEGLRYEIM